MKDQEYEYIYDEEEDKKYCYPGSSVLINRLDIRDHNDLHTAEREGNGRSQRLFCEQLCKNNGRFALDFSNADKEEMVEASKKSFIRDYSGMEKLIRKHMKEEK